MKSDVEKLCLLTTEVFEKESFDDLIKKYQGFIDDFKSIVPKTLSTWQWLSLTKKSLEVRGICEAFVVWSFKNNKNDEYLDIYCKLGQSLSPLSLNLIGVLKLTHILYTKVSRKANRRVDQRQLNSLMDSFDSFLSLSNNLLETELSLSSSFNDKLALLTLTSDILKCDFIQKNEPLIKKIASVRTYLISHLFESVELISLFSSNINPLVYDARRAAKKTPGKNLSAFYLDELPANMKSYADDYLNELMFKMLNNGTHLRTEAEYACFYNTIFSKLKQYFEKSASRNLSCGNAYFYNGVLHAAMQCAEKVKQHLLLEHLVFLSKVKPCDIAYFKTAAYDVDLIGYKQYFSAGLMGSFFYLVGQTHLKAKDDTISDKALVHEFLLQLSTWSAAVLAYAAYYNRTDDFMTVRVNVPFGEPKIPEWLMEMLPQTILTPPETILPPPALTNNNASTESTQIKKEPFNKTEKTKLFQEYRALMIRYDSRAADHFKSYGAMIYEDTMQHTFSDRTDNAERFLDIMRQEVGKWFAVGALPIRIKEKVVFTTASAQDSKKSDTIAPFLFGYARRENSEAKGLAMDLHIAFFDHVSQMREDHSDTEVSQILRGAGALLSGEGITENMLDKNTHGDIIQILQYSLTPQAISIREARQAATQFLNSGGVVSSRRPF